jgi:hypothetical protein
MGELARSHSTTELLSLALSFYSTCAFRDNLLHPHYPHSHPHFGISLLGSVCRGPVWQKALAELTLSVPCLAAVVYVVHSHVHMRLAKHARPPLGRVHCRSGTSKNLALQGSCIPTTAGLARRSPVCRPPKNWVCRIVATQSGLGSKASWVRGIANASGLHIGVYRAEPA